MKIMDLLDDVFSESVEISPVLARISPALAQRKSPETGHLSPISPFSPTPTIIEQARANISPVALSWLRENKVQLRKQGWRPSELWRRNKSKGIAWAGVWNLPGLSVTIESAGSLSFHFLTATGQTIKQTAWPKLNQKRSPYYERHK